MAVPTSYDYNTFASYLKDEVLRYVADAMLWDVEAGADVVAGAAQVVTVNGATADQDHFITVDALPAKIYAGNEVTFTGHGTTYAAALDMDIGTTQLYIYPYVNGVIADNTVGAYTPLAHRATHSVYRAITDESLLALGFTEISQVTGFTNIQKLRLKGRVEAWRAVLSNTLGDVDVENEGQTFSRSQTFNAAQQQLSYAEQEYAQLFGFGTQSNILPQTTDFGIVKAVW